MKLRRLHIQRLPGIDEPFTIDHLGDGFHVIVGPNGIGKSSLCRALRSLLWKDLDPASRIAAMAIFEQDGESWTVERDGSRHVWQRDGAESDSPVLPASHLNGCFFLGLRDLLNIKTDAGRTVATEIRRQMSGGFDLEGAAQSLFGLASGPRFGRKERRETDNIDREIRQAVSRHARLADREAELEELDAQAAAAKVARQRLGHYDLAIGIMDLRDEFSQAKADLTALPKALKRMTGAEIELIDQRGKELETKCRLRSETKGSLKDADKAAVTTRLEESLDPAKLATWRGRADNLSDIEKKLGDARRELTECQEAVAEASRLLGASGEVAPAIDLAGDSDLFTFLNDYQQVEEKLEAIDERLRLLAERVFSEEDGQRLESLRLGVEPLRAWLRAPNPDAWQGPSAGILRRNTVLASSTILIALGAILGVMLHPAFTVLAGLGLGLSALLWRRRTDASVGYARVTAQQDFPAGLEPPRSWTTAETVLERLRELESELVKLNVSSEREAVRIADRATLESRRRGLAALQPELETRRRALALRLDLDDIPPTAELVDMARALDHLRRKRVAESAAAARVDATQKHHGSLLLKIADALVAHGEAKPTDAASARAGIDSLSQRSQDLRDAQRAQKNAKLTLNEIDEEISRIEKIIARIYRKAGLDTGDRTGLVQLLQNFNLHRDLLNKRNECKMSIKRSVSKLASAGESDLAGRDRARLEVEEMGLKAKVDDLTDLHQKISDIRTEVRQAREGHSMEDLLAKQSDALAGLRDRQEEAMRAGAGRFLVEAVQREHETNQMPRVLEYARNLFQTFTHQTYELQVAKDDAASFIAIKAETGIGHRPDELSDGTRAQLLLAARLAFAEEAEQGNRMPFFLDEALDHSDPVRFRAIARSLGRMVEDEGRQIFYLTNDPTDTQRIQEALKEEGCAPPKIIDLALIRGRAESVPGPDTLFVEPLPGVPNPAGETPENYGAALQVPPLDPRRGHMAQHLLYVLWDDLPLLHRLLENRILRVGQWALLSRSQAPLACRIKADEGNGTQLDARADLLEEFCRSWCEGRGRPVDREAIEQSDAITGSYLNAVTEIAIELGGDGERLIENLRARDDKRLKGFRTKAADAFETFLTDENYIDPRLILEESDIVARAMTIPAAGVLPERVGAHFLHLWWNLCEQALSDRN